MTRRIIRLPEVIEITRLSRTTIYRLINEGRFPKQVKLSVRASGWFEDEIAEWQKEIANAPQTVYREARTILETWGR